jgi:hypothetical protein
MTSHKYAVGDEVCVVVYGWRRGDEPTVEVGTVAKVGRKWLHVRHGYTDTMFDQDTGAEKTEFSARTFLYPSEAHYREHRLRSDAWEALQGWFYKHRGDAPEHLTAEWMEQAVRTLKGEP